MSISWKIKYLILKPIIKVQNSRKYEIAKRIDSKTKGKTQMVQKQTDTFSANGFLTEVQIYFKY